MYRVSFIVYRTFIRYIYRQSRRVYGIVCRAQPYRISCTRYLVSGIIALIIVFRPRFLIPGTNMFVYVSAQNIFIDGV